MKMTIEPRKPTDRGGLLCMPLVRNVPNFGERHTAQIVTCPRCGAECWEPEGTAEIVEKQGVEAVCTFCALRAGFECAT